jgi:hypothetical protein
MFINVNILLVRCGKGVLFYHSLKFSGRTGNILNAKLYTRHN